MARLRQNTASLVALLSVLSLHAQDNNSSVLNATASTLAGPIQHPIGGVGTTNYIPIWTDNSGDLGNSVLFQSGSGNNAKVGLGLTNPAAKLDVKGSILSRG